MLFPIGELIGDRRLTTIEHSKPVSDALQMMIANDFSYLPVVDGQGKLTGMISEQVIVRKYYHFGGDKLLYDLEVAHCQMRAMTLPPTADIFDALTPLQTVGAIVVVDTGMPVGIITDFDTTQFFRAYSEGIILAQDIEFNLRRHIEDVFPVSSPELDGALVTAFGYTKDQRRAGRPNREYNEISLWDHVLLILTDGNWQRFEIALKPKTMFQKLLEPVRDARNQMAHFRGELTAVQLDALKQARYWLENRQVVSALQATAPIVVNVTDITGTNSVSQTGDAIDNSSSTEANIPGNSDGSDNLSNSENSRADATSSQNEISQNDGQPLEADTPQIKYSTRDRERRFEKKYTPLEQWLRTQADEQTHIRVDFQVIEKIIGESLPPSARQHSNWWANDSTGRSQSNAWLSAGWRVESVDLDAEKVVFRRENSLRMQEFFGDVLARFKQLRPEATRASKAQLQTWFTFSAGRPGFSYSWAFGYQGLRVELYIDTTNYDINKRYFDTLLEHKSVIEEKIGKQLDWRRLENRRASRIFLERPGKITDPPEALEQYKEWAVHMMAQFIDAFQPIISQLETLSPTSIEKK